jgi:hypothetical protein
MSAEDPPRLVDEAGDRDPIRAALRHAATPPPFDPATRGRVLAKVTAEAARPGLAAGPLWMKAALALVVSLSVAAGLAARRAPSAPIAARAEPRLRSSETSTEDAGPSSATGAVTMAGAERARERVAPPLAPRRSAESPEVRVSVGRAPRAAIERTSAANARLAGLERDLLEQAQRALEREGDAGRALSLLGEHRRRFPRSPLEEERAYLTLRSRLRAGDVDGARALAQAFLRSFPASLYASAARRIAGGTR